MAFELWICCIKINFFSIFHNFCSLHRSFFPKIFVNVLKITTEEKNGIAFYSPFFCHSGSESLFDCFYFALNSPKAYKTPPERTFAQE
jgi:hypothetical protein